MPHSVHIPQWVHSLLWCVHHRTLESKCSWSAVHVCACQICWHSSIRGATHQPCTDLVHFKCEWFSNHAISFVRQLYGNGNDNRHITTRVAAIVVSTNASRFVESAALHVLHSFEFSFFLYCVLNVKRSLQSLPGVFSWILQSKIQPKKKKKKRRKLDR